MSIISTPDHATTAVREATRAVEFGARANHLLPPFLFGLGRPAILAHLAAMLEAVAPIPVEIQHAPAQMGGQLTVGNLTVLAEAHPNLAAITVESRPPGRLVSALAEQDPPLPSLVGYAGRDAIDAFERGAVGLQPGCSFPEFYVELTRRWDDCERDAAHDLRTSMLPYQSAWRLHVELIVAVEKRISAERGLFVDATVRASCWNLDENVRATIDAFLKEFDRWLR